MRRARPLLASLALAAACASTPPPTAAPSTAPAVRAAAAALSSFVRAGWHLPLRIRVLLSDHDGDPAPPPAARAREEALAVAQLDAARAAISRAAFDVLALDLVVDPDARAPEVDFDPETAGLRVRLPAPAARAPATAADAAPVTSAVVGPDALLDAVAAGFDWRRLGPWWRGEPGPELAAALRRDLGKVDALEDELTVQCRRVELLSALVVARAEATGQDPQLTPSEAQGAREAQVRILFALQRALNTIARWGAAVDDPTFPWPAEARLARRRALLVHRAHLGWLLDVLVGGRPLLAVWSSRWWHRNPLYPVLDAAAALEVHLGDADAVVCGVGPSRATLPAGSVRGLLRARCDGDLAALADRAQAEPPPPPAAFARSPARAEAEAALRREPRTRATLEAHDVTAFRAWKELWDARLKNGVEFPLYHAVAGVSTFLGDTRVTEAPPALRGLALSALAARLRPGDVLLVREEGFLSNAFLPGFWPHALIWLGPPEAWGALRLEDGTALRDDPVGRRALERWRTVDGHAPRVLEAVSEGVVFSSVEHALRKDHVAVLRPELDEGQVAAALRRALPLLGRPYDFDFDFTTDDRLVCTEVVYRAYDAALNFRVQVDGAPGASPRVPGLVPVLGRLTMPANELARYALFMADRPAPDPARGYPGRRLAVVAVVARDEASGEARVLEGPPAVAALRASVER